MPEEKRIIASKNASYEVVRTLGEGFAGEVFEVKDLKRGENVALKLLKGGAVACEQLAPFKREFGILTGFHHPHLCKVYDFGFAESDSRHFFTVELVKGTNLYAHTDKLPVEKIEEIFVEIADALGFIHSAGIIHFDLKGGNVLVTSIDGKPIAKIIDFGLAVPPVDAPLDIVGTVRYMSPEMITKEQAIDYRADLYSLGMVLYRMLAGRYPPQGVTMEEILAWHVGHTSVDTVPLKEKGVPQYLIDVVEKLLNPVPAERFSSAQVIIKYIELHSGRRYQKSQRELLTTLTEEGPLVGRTDLIYKIRSAAHKLSTGEPFGEKEGQILLLKGPRGIGKSRLLKEARYLAQLGGASTAAIRGSEEGRSVTDFAKALGMEIGANEVTPSKLAEFILQQEKMFLTVDNLDECHQAVRGVLTDVAGALYSSRLSGRPAPVYIIAALTSQGAETEPSAPALIGANTEHLSPLTREEIIEYQKSFLGESSPPSQQTDDILKFSGGSPELVRTAIASLESPTGRLSGDTKQFFRAHIDKLTLPAKRALGCMAIAEKPLTHEELTTAMESDAHSAVGELIRTGLAAFSRKSGAYELTALAIVEPAKDSLPADELKTIAGRLLKIAQNEKKPDIDRIARLAKMGLAPDETLDILLKASLEKDEDQEPAIAHKYNGEAIAIMGDKDERAPAIHRKMARYLILADKYEDAVRHIDLAGQNSSVTAEDLISKSWIERLRHKPAEALKFIEEAVNICKPGESSPEHLRLKNETALCRLQMGEFQKAIEIFTETGNLAKKLPDKDQIQIRNNNLGMAYAMEGDFEKAVKFYREKLARFAGDKRMSSSILSQLAYAYEKAGKTDDAIESYKRSWGTAFETGDIHSAATILGNLINLFINRAYFSDALHYAKESLNVSSKASSEKDVASNLLTIGNLYINLGLEDVAQRYLNEALSIFKKISDARMEGWAILSLAYLGSNTGKKDEAAALFTLAIERGNSSGDVNLKLLGHHGIAELMLDSNRAADAAPHVAEIDKAKETADMTTDKAIKLELISLRFAFASGSGNKKEIIKKLADLSESSAKLGFRELAGEAHYILSACYKELGDEKMCQRHVARAKEMIDDIAGTLSEEYHDSFMKQAFRQMVFEESVRLDPSIVKKLGLGKTKEKQVQKAGTAGTKVTDRTTELPSDRTTELPGKKGA